MHRCLALCLLLAACGGSGPSPPEEIATEAALQTRGTSRVYYLGPKGLPGREAEIAVGKTLGARWTRVEVPIALDGQDDLDLATARGVRVTHEFAAANPAKPGGDQQWFRLELEGGQAGLAGRFRRDGGLVRVVAHYEGPTMIWGTAEPVPLVFDLETGMPLVDEVQP